MTVPPDRPRVGAAVLRDNGREILMVRHRRRDGSTYWQLPGGGVHPGETENAAVLRELYEETGLTGTVIRKLFSMPYKYGLSTAYLVRIDPDAEPVLGIDPEEQNSDHQKLIDVAWQCFADFEQTAELARLRTMVSEGEDLT